MEEERERGGEEEVLHGGDGRRRVSGVCRRSVDGVWVAATALPVDGASEYQAHADGKMAKKCFFLSPGFHGKTSALFEDLNLLS